MIMAVHLSSMGSVGLARRSVCPGRERARKRGAAGGRVGSGVESAGWKCSGCMGGASERGGGGGQRGCTRGGGVHRLVQRSYARGC